MTVVLLDSLPVIRCGENALTHAHTYEREREQKTRVHKIHSAYSIFQATTKSKPIDEPIWFRQKAPGSVNLFSLLQ